MPHCPAGSLLARAIAQFAQILKPVSRGLLVGLEPRAIELGPYLLQ